MTEPGVRFSLDGMASPQDAPKSKEDFEARFERTFQVKGYGISGMRTHHPCPFCAAPDFFIVGVLDMTDVMRAGSRCRECKRGARAAFEPIDGGDGTRVMLLQTTGPDPDPWIAIPRDPQATAETEPIPPTLENAGDGDREDFGFTVPQDPWK